MPRPMSLRPAVITGVGSYVPDEVLTNEDLEKIVETSDEWIVSHTGIKERRIASDEQASSDLGKEAALAALDDAGLTPNDVQLIICPTVTPDHLFPVTGNMIQAALGAENTAAFDLLSGCTGFVYGLWTARQFVATGELDCVLVVAAEKLTSITNWTDRSTCVLFGDGAGAAVVQPGEGDPSETGLLSFVLESYGEHGYLLDIPAGGSRRPLDEEALANHEHCLRMNGPELYKIAVRGVPDVAEKAIEGAGLTNHDIDWVVMHQANMRIIDAAARRLDIPNDHMVVNIEKFGNTSGASIAIALDEAYRDGRIQPGDNVLLVGFGAGFSLGAGVLRWGN
ncbi:MAG: beta-ketoacyl-ACP synthase III [Armatimonadia bacterium]|nr:beta-ketoacyl-ACP synthase III [Armatimonadia bacterium]